MEHCALYHFKYPVKDDDFFMLDGMKKRTPINPDDDIGDYMIESAFSYVPKINDGLYSYGALFCMRDKMVCVGTLVYSVDMEGACMIHKMGVKKEHRGTGVGKDLLNQLKHYMLFIHVTKIHLYASNDERVIQFYLDNGFTRDNPESTHMTFNPS